MSVVSFSIGNTSYVNVPISELDAYQLSEDEKASLIRDAMWREAKLIRDNLLAETDYTQMSDNPLSIDKKDEFKVYRQTLRDIPQTYNDPDTVVWPEKPTV